MKYSVAIFLFLLSVGCSKKDSHYYWQNPNKIKQALSDCPMKKPDGLTCEELAIVATKFRYLATELKQNPQLFGLRIIALQQKISQVDQMLSKKKDQQLAKDLKQNKMALTEYLAVVSYYESPKGVKDEDSGQ